jgi:hypothetical protein
MTRNELKELVREVLVELITEGASPRAQRPSPMKEAASPPPMRRTINGMSLDRPAIPGAQRQQQQPRPEAARTSAAAAQRAVKGLTSDPVLSSIFSDTAATTLQEQISAERMGPGRIATPESMALAETDPTDLFGGGSANWATLAFAEDRQR